MATLKEEGLYDKAIIVFTADHGEMFGSHMLWQKMCMYEESAKVPFSYQTTQNSPVAIKESQILVSLVDILPTLLDYNSLPIPPKRWTISKTLIEGKIFLIGTLSLFNMMAMVHWGVPSDAY
ncbi:MAG: sulfatase-like hydrolase/transferase [Spirosomataceae bacterium]